MGISSAGSCRGCACARSLPARRWRSTAPTLQRGQPGATFCMMAWKAVAATVLIAAALRPSSAWAGAEGRSEEHTSELQSRLHLVCRLLLEKKKKLVKRYDPRCNVERSVG